MTVERVNKTVNTTPAANEGRYPYDVSMEEEYATQPAWSTILNSRMNWLLSSHFGPNLLFCCFPHEEKKRGTLLKGIFIFHFEVEKVRCKHVFLTAGLGMQPSGSFLTVLFFPSSFNCHRYAHEMREMTTSMYSSTCTEYGALTHHLTYERTA